MSTIIFNGKTYNRIEDMPAGERQAFEQMSQMFVDKNGNGIPDFLEGDIAMNVMTASSGSFTMNGQTYSNVDEMPEEMRNKVKSAFDMMAKMGLVSKSTFTQMTNLTGNIQQDQAPVSKPFLTSQPSSAIEEENGKSTFLWVLGGIVLCFALVTVTIAVFYFMGR